MAKISDICKKANIETGFKEEGLAFYSVRQEPFVINGVYYDNGKFRRMPEEVAKNVSSEVLRLHSHTSGGRVRFKTNSPFVAVNVKLGSVTRIEY